MGGRELEIKKWEQKVGAVLNYQKESECNICGNPYHPKSNFSRFCDECKQYSEIYRYHDSTNQVSYESIVENSKDLGIVDREKDPSKAA